MPSQNPLKAGKVQQETVSMWTRDGVRLDADIYRPQTDERLPVLLMRQPYGRAIASTVVYAHPKWYAARGYMVVIQDVRGRGTSEGEFELFAREKEDGADTIDWVAQLNGSTGDVGMYGFSYQGMTQLYAAASRPAALKTICPGAIAYDLYRDWAYENGAFCLQANLGWAVQLAAETARIKKDYLAYQTLYAASRNLPLHNPSIFTTESFRKYTPSNFYYSWLNHPDPDSYWQELSPKTFISDVDLPMLHICGWFDPYLRGTLNLYEEMSARSKFPQHLIVGPWAHLPWGRKLGAIDYGPEAVSPVDELQIKWFDRILKGIESPKSQPVKLFSMGSNKWRYFQQFPSANPGSYYLTSNGLASMREDAGSLVKEKDKNNLNNFDSLDWEDILVHDPWRPVPALGGHASSPAGSFDRSGLDCRSDILTYTSPVLELDLHLAGKVEVEIYCSANVPSFDLCAVLSTVDETHGKVYNFSQGYKRVNGEEKPVVIPLQATCICIAKGQRLRLSLSAACFPAYPVNPGIDESAKDMGLMAASIITLTVSSGVNNPSRVLLPVVGV